MRKLLLETLNPFFAIFMATFAISGFFISMLTPIQIEIWVGIFFANLVVCGWLFWRLKPDFSAGSEPERQWSRFHHLLALIPLLIPIVPPLLVTLSNTHFQVWYHGDLHSAYLNQILVNTSPPVNPFLPDYPPNYYWLYHALLATLVRVTGLPSPLIWSMLSYVLLLSVFGWIIQSLRVMGLKDRSPLLLSLIALFIIFSMNLFGSLHAADDILAGGRFQRQHMVWMGDIRLTNLLAKFTNFNSFPLGVLYFASSIYAALRLVRGPFRVSTFNLFIASVIGGFAFQLLTGVFILAALVPAMAAAVGVQVLWSVSPFRVQAVVEAGRDAVLKLWRQLSPRLWAVLLVLSGITAVFMLWYYKTATQSATVTGELTLGMQENWESFFGAFYPLLPLFLAALIYGWRSRNQFSILTSVGALIGFATAVLVTMRGDNQYKLVHFSAFFISMTIVLMLLGMMSQRNRPVLRWLGRVVLAIVCSLSILNVTYFYSFMRYVQYMVDQGNVSNNQLAYYEGHHINSEVQAYQTSFSWIREHTPPSTIIVMPIPSSRRLPIFGERLPYVGIQQFSFVIGLDEYEERVHIVETLLSTVVSSEERQAAAAHIRAFDSDRPIIALVPHNIEVPTSEWDALEMTLLHSTENSDLYLLRECVACEGRLAG